MYAVGAFKQIGAQQLQIHFTDEQLFLPYPCTYGTEFSDPFTYTYDYSGGTVNGEGQGSFFADGFGTLVLPDDTIYNVLKLSGTDTISEGIPGTSYVTTMDQVYFYKPGIHYYVLSATHLSQSMNGGPPQQGGSISYLGSSAFAGVREGLAQAIGMEAWPNPARDFVTIAYGLAAGHNVQLQLFDGFGRCLRTQQLRTVNSGIQQARLDVQGLPSGVYFLHALDDHGQHGACRVVVH